MSGILIATNGSGYARTAIERAVDLARDADAPLYAICVVDRRTLDEPGLSTGELATTLVEDTGHASIREVVTAAERAGVTAEGVVRHGIPHEEIVAHADELDVDAIVVGAHGDHTGHLGGVARKVQELTDREVVVVEPGVEA